MAGLTPGHEHVGPPIPGRRPVGRAGWTSRCRGDGSRRTPPRRAGY